MAGLKELKGRIASTKSTQKITKAMQMVAAAKLRRAVASAEGSRPYTSKMAEIIGSLATSETNPLITGKGGAKLIIVATSNRGLCGAFNTNILKAARIEIAQAKSSNEDFKLILIGNKTATLANEFASRVYKTFAIANNKPADFGVASEVARTVVQGFENGDFGTAAIVYSKFVNVITQEAKCSSLIPLDIKETASTTAPEFEPKASSVLKALLPKNIAMQVYSCLLENSASEQASRMTAMDNATRNAKDMIEKLSLVYNRTRQANITRELIEIISGAEAL
jgi:F-type H+-transporting ATPase subunit gamma